MNYADATLQETRNEPFTPQTAATRPASDDVINLYGSGPVPVEQRDEETE